MGTSLTVHPFASLIDNVNDDCVRLLINRDTAMNNSGGFLRSMMFGEGFCFNMPNNRRDVAWKGDCDAGCYLLADKLGYGVSYIFYMIELKFSNQYQCLILG